MSYQCMANLLECLNKMFNFLIKKVQYNTPDFNNT